MIRFQLTGSEYNKVHIEYGVSRQAAHIQKEVYSRQRSRVGAPSMEHEPPGTKRIITPTAAGVAD